MSRFRFEIKHISGVLNPADPLSRLFAIHGVWGTLPRSCKVPRAKLFALHASLKCDQLTKFEQAYKDDPYFQDPRKTRKLKFENGLWYSQGKIVVPKTLRELMIEQHHANRVVGHFGFVKTYDLLCRQYWWPCMYIDCKAYCKACAECQRNKASTQTPYGLLRPLEIPDSRWDVITMDYITDLPRSNEGHTAVLIFVEKLTKYVIIVL